MQICKGEQQAFSPLECPLYTNQMNQMINDLNALGFKPILNKKSSMVMEGIPKRLTKLHSVLFKSSLWKQVGFRKLINVCNLVHDLT